MIAQQFSDQPGSLKQKRIHVWIYDDYVFTDAVDTVTRYTWRSFFKISRSDEHTLMWITKHMALIVPDRAFGSKDDAMQMYLFAEDRWNQID